MNRDNHILTTEQLASNVDQAKRRMWHAQMIVDGAREPAPKVLAALDARISEYRAASAAWAESYFATAA